MDWSTEHTTDYGEDNPLLWLTVSHCPPQAPLLFRTHLSNPQFTLMLLPKSHPALPLSFSHNTNSTTSHPMYLSWTFFCFCPSRLSLVVPCRCEISHENMSCLLWHLNMLAFIKNLQLLEGQTQEISDSDSSSYFFHSHSDNNPWLTQQFVDLQKGNSPNHTYYQICPPFQYCLETNLGASFLCLPFGTK